MELISIQPREFLFHFGVSQSDLLKFKIILDSGRIKGCGGI